MEELNFDTEFYRDQIATVDKSGKRVWVYPKRPKGRFYNMRSYVSWLLLAIMFGLPFVQMNGEPFMLFNILERRFILFGVGFAPQDFHLFVLAMLTFMVFIILFTVIYGRLFCGWVCPQTIFMEMLFRKVEYWIEGDSQAQQRLNKAPWTTDKLLKKGAKQGIFIFISILIAHTFLSYIIGVEEVFKIVSQSPSKNPTGFSSMVIFTAIFYYVFAHFREQVCTTVCPYGRLQGVLTDDKTIMISYDFVRGEPRGRIKKQQKKSNPILSIQSAVTGAAQSPEATNAESPIKIGDCIDCSLCVQVCPTGIDIRNGVQLECTNCTACMDACDEVMDKIKRPRGLIRYDSYEGIVSNNRHIFTPRVKAYSVVLIILLGLNVFFLSGRSDVETVILRTPGMLYQEVDETYISNLYNYQIINKTNKAFPVQFKIGSAKGRIKYVGDAKLMTKKNEMIKGVFFIEMEKKAITSMENTIWIEIYSGDKLIDKTKTNFIGPIR
jgi:cytochrome c oxidase accessory protein FixG